MVIEYCNGGTLESEIMARRRIPENEAIAILKQLIIGLSVNYFINLGTS
jgi:serine/threonine protein kinase